MSEARQSMGFILKEGFSPVTLDRVQREAVAMMDEVGVPKSQRHAVTVVIEELCTNIMEHSHATWLEVGISKSGDKIELAFADDGLAFDPSNAINEAPSSARLTRSVDRHLGLYMISSLTRGFEYFRDEVGVNIMQLEILPEAV